jgi:hypothetical protein
MDFFNQFGRGAGGQIRRDFFGIATKAPRAGASRASKAATTIASNSAVRATGGMGAYGPSVAQDIRRQVLRNTGVKSGHRSDIPGIKMGVQNYRSSRYNQQGVTLPPYQINRSPNVFIEDSGLRDRIYGTSERMTLGLRNRF